MAMAWHTTRGEEQTNETTMEEQTETNDNGKIRWQMVVTNHVDDWRHLLYFYIYEYKGISYGEAPSIYRLSTPCKIYATILKPFRGTLDVLINSIAKINED